MILKFFIHFILLFILVTCGKFDPFNLYDDADESSEEALVQAIETSSDSSNTVEAKIILNKEAKTIGQIIAKTKTSETGNYVAIKVSLSKKPTHSVTVGFSSDNSLEGIVPSEYNTLILTQDNWNDEHYILVQGIDDSIDDDDKSYKITATSTSEDKNFNNLSTQIELVNEDNENSDTSSGDITAPQVISILPSNNSTNIAINSSISITFSEIIKSDSVSYPANSSCTGSIQLSSDDFSTCHVLNAPSSSDQKTFVFALAQNLSYSENYKLKISTAIKDNAENSLATIANYSFSTPFLKAYTFGRNDKNQLGLGDNSNRTIPVEISGITGIQAVTAGERHTVFLMGDGSVKTFGLNDKKQLCLGATDTTDRNTPTNIASLTSVKQIASGEYHTVFLMEDGTVKTCGDNTYGQLGHGDKTARGTPTSLSDISGVKAIAAGDTYTLLLMNDNSVKNFGRHHYGQLGHGNTDLSDRTSPTDLTACCSNVKQIAAGEYHTLFLLNDGTVKSVGNNSDGQLGLSSDDPVHYNPMAISGLSQNVSQVISGAGSFHSLMIMADKTVMSFGWNQFGQLGLGTNGGPDITSPQAITGLSNVKQAAASYMHTLLLFEDGTVKSFGYGSYGQLGHNDNAMHNSPKDLINFANVQIVAVGAYHSIILSY